MRISLSALLAVVVLCVVPACASASALPGLLTEIGHGPPFAVRPAQIIYTGDGSGVLGGFTGTGPLPRFGRLAWTLWTQREAVGRGAVWLDDCRPNCAEGRFHPFAVRVRATDPAHGHFLRLTLRYRFEGREVVDRRGVTRHGRFYTY